MDVRREKRKSAVTTGGKIEHKYGRSSSRQNLLTAYLSWRGWLLYDDPVDNSISTHLSTSTFE